MFKKLKTASSASCALLASLWIFIYKGSIDLSGHNPSVPLFPWCLKSFPSHHQACAILVALSIPLFCFSLPLSFVSYSLPPLSSFPCLALSSILIPLSFKPATVSSLFFICFLSPWSPGVRHLYGPLLPSYTIPFISDRLSYNLPPCAILVCPRHTPREASHNLKHKMKRPLFSMCSILWL